MQRIPISLLRSAVRNQAGLRWSLTGTLRDRTTEKTPRFGHSIVFQSRFYSQEVGNQPPKQPLPPPKLTTTPKPQTTPHPRHEVHEGSAAINVPFNPPGGGAGPGLGGSGSVFPLTSSPLLDAALTTVIGLGMVFVGGIAYVKWYKKRVLDKIEEAFAPGYDPALELAKPRSKHKDGKAKAEPGDVEEYEGDLQFKILRRKEQDLIDNIVQGHEPGHYFVLLGPKGSGKGTMIFDSMGAIEADGVALCEAHPDLEVFRLRLGKALNYEYNEDSQTGLFQRRDPREGGPALDIERALNKLEKVALRSYQRRGKPLILIVNNIHHFKNDDDGRNILLQMQQRAEAWAASGILTLVLSTDDFWPFYVMRKGASRMHVVNIYDLTAQEAFRATTRIRSLRKKGQPVDPEAVSEALSIVGGRLSYINKISKARDMVDMAKHLLAVEKAWLQSQIGLIPDCDDDVMDEQKWSSCSWLLLREFAKLREEQERERDTAIQAGERAADDLELPLPVIPYWRCRQIMTRADFLEELDRVNIIAIDVEHNVRPDSMLILQSAMEVVNEEDFDEILDGVRDRIDEIESLHRTRELTFKDVDKGDMIRLSVDKGGAELIATLRG